MQKYFVISEYRKEDYIDNIQELKESYGRNKKFVRGYVLAALLALRNYPELADIKITFKFNKSHHPLATRPNMLSLFKKPKDREYQIFISTEAKGILNKILMKNLSFDVQIGQIAHEIGHVVDYLDKSTVAIIKNALTYKIDGYKSHLEHRVDNIAIKHGFGNQLIRFAELIETLSVQYPQEKYLTHYFKYYLTPTEILKKIRTLKLYNPDK